MRSLFYTLLIIKQRGTMVSFLRLGRFAFLLLVSLSVFLIPGVSLAAQELLGQSPSTTEIFGAEQGYIHPSLKVAAEYTDNYYSEESNEESEWTTTISPAVWLSLPASGNQFVPIVTSTDAPGGQGISRFQQEGLMGFQGALIYRADIELNKEHSEDNAVNHLGQGTLQYNFASGLTIELSDIYQLDYDDFAKGSSASREEYRSNLANAI